MGTGILVADKKSEKMPQENVEGPLAMAWHLHSASVSGIKGGGLEKQQCPKVRGT